MSKNKLKKFAEMQSFSNVFQCTPEDISLAQPHHLAGSWHTQVFHNEHPIVLELGCGRGEYTVALAQLFPDKNFIGIDIKGARIYAGAKQALDNQLHNAAFLRTNIEFIYRFFAQNEVDEIWITFPDPQMKKATKRLTSTFFLQRYQRILKNNGIIHLKTDSPFLYTYTSELVKTNALPTLVNTPDLYAAVTDDPVLTLKTHYEKQWLSRGMTIKYISFTLPQDGNLQEPDIQIEKDTYRSYGRNYTFPHSNSNTL